MPPKAKANAAAVPQRSIMSFFGGGSGAKAAVKSSGKTPTNKVLAKSVAEPMDLTTTTPPKATVEPDSATTEPAADQTAASQNKLVGNNKENQAGCGADDHFFGSTFSHRGPNGGWEVYDAAANLAIAKAMTASPNGGSVLLPNAPSFEVRWGTAATSTKMPKMPTTGLIQVNLDTDNTRLVRFNNDGPAVPALAALVGAGWSKEAEGELAVAAASPSKGDTAASPKKRSATVHTPSASAVTPSVKRATHESTTLTTPASASSTLPTADTVPVASTTPAAVTPASYTTTSAPTTKAEASSSGIKDDDDDDDDDSAKVVCCNWEAPEEGEAWCAAVLAALAEAVALDSCAKLAVGFDCEWCPPWWAAAGVGDAVQTIQLYAPGKGSLVYSTGHLGMAAWKKGAAKRRPLPPQLTALLAEPRILKVGVNIHGDTARVAANFFVPVAAAHNVQLSAAGAAAQQQQPMQRALSTASGSSTKKSASKSQARAASGSASLEDLSLRFCPPHLHIDKSDAASKVRTGNWSVWPLSADQVKYAALDAVVSYWIFAGVLGGEWPQTPSPAALGNAKMELRTVNPAEEVQGGEDEYGLVRHASAPAASSGTNSSNKRAKTIGDGDGDRDGGEEEGTTGMSAKEAKAEAAKQSFYLMHRNKSIKPPNAGIKEHPKGPPTCLKHVVCVVSGVLDSMSREQLTAYVEQHGGTCVKAVTKKTTHLLNDHGEVGPAKKAKCEQLGVAVVGEDFILDLVRTAAAAAAAAADK